MQYTLVRQKKRDENGHWYYSVVGKEEFIVCTNYRERIKKAEWYAKYNCIWKFEQYNKSRSYMHYIPILDIYANAVYYRKYKIFCNQKIVGETDCYDDTTAPTGTRRDKIEILNKEYYVRVGNTCFRRSGKKYKWSIEDSNGDEVATIRRETREGIFEIESNENLGIEVIAILVMMTDQQKLMKSVKPRTSRY